MAEVERHETAALIASDRVEGTAVYDHNGDRLGSVSSLMIGKRDGQVEYAVLSFGGFLGIGNDHYPIPWKMLTYDIEKGGYVTELDKARLTDAPRYQSDDRPLFDEAYARSVYSYYGLAPVF